MAVEIYKGTEGKIYLGETTTTDVQNVAADTGLSLTAPAAANLVGKVETFTIKLENSVEEYFGCGDRDATDIKEGLRKISGTLNRAIVNGALFTAAMGTSTGASPYVTTSKTDDSLSVFKLELKLTQATNYISIIVNSVKFDSWEITANNAGDTIIENMEWKGIFNSAQYVGVPAAGI